MKLLYIDIETRSRTDLKKLGVYKYVEDFDFYIMMAGWSIGEGTKVAVGEEEILRIPGLLDPSVPKVAHNAQFERVCLSTLDECLRDPAQWVDTASIAAEHGYPVSLEAAASALGAEPKDSAGTRLINLFCKPRKDGGWNGADTHPEEWLDFLLYCEQDVETLIDVHARLGGWPTEVERLVWIADQRINDRGMRIDTELASLAQAVSFQNTEAMKFQVTELTGLANPGSVQQMMAWAKEVGLNLPDMQKETIAAALEGYLHPDHREVLELRQELALAAASKYTAALERVSPDERVRGSFRFFGAHTGRWTGQGVQPQNLPREAFKTEVEQDEAILNLKLGEGTTQLELKKLVRPLFLGPLTVVDYASIEARVVAWLANEEWALQAFRDGRDIYVETASRMSTPSTPLTRFQGKVAVLALGYNGGVNSLRAMGAEGNEEELFRLVQVWRRANPRIVKLWEVMGDAVESGGRVGPHIRISRRGSTMKMHLPSGRAITYHEVKWERYVVIVDGKRVHKEGWRYADPKRGGARIGTYGGRLVENATQAIARDVLAEALVRLEEAGYAVVGHVHDEVIVESEDLQNIERLMLQQPRWAKGLPLDAEGFVTDRYRKG